MIGLPPEATVVLDLLWPIKKIEIIDRCEAR
jgi:hypothetical protein